MVASYRCETARRYFARSYLKRTSYSEFCQRIPLRANEYRVGSHFARLHRASFPLSLDSLLPPAPICPPSFSLSVSFSVAPPLYLSTSVTNLEHVRRFLVSRQTARQIVHGDLMKEREIISSRYAETRKRRERLLYVAAGTHFTMCLHLLSVSSFPNNCLPEP